MGFFGFVLAYSMRFNLSLAIVEMVDQPHVLITNLKSKTAANASSILSQDLEVCPHHIEVLRHGSSSVNSSELLSGNVRAPRSADGEQMNWRRFGEKRFHWTEEEQGEILGSFFWGYIFTQVCTYSCINFYLKMYISTQYPGGKLAHVYGAKWIFSVGLLITGALSSALPFVTVHWGKNGILTLRVIMGLAEVSRAPNYSFAYKVVYWLCVENSVLNCVYIL